MVNVCYGTEQKRIQDDFWRGWLDQTSVFYEFGKTGLRKRSRSGSDAADHPAILHTFMGSNMDSLNVV